MLEEIDEDEEESQNPCRGNLSQTECPENAAMRENGSGKSWHDDENETGRGGKTNVDLLK
jgi:hypothetical protein